MTVTDRPCPNCSHPNSTDERLCEQCGKPLPSLEASRYGPPETTAEIRTVTPPSMRFEVRPGTVLGRGRGADVDLEPVSGSGKISRQHARVICEGGAWFIEHLSGTNTTRVAGALVTGRAPLRAGDNFALGGVTFIFRIPR